MFQVTLYIDHIIKNKLFEASPLLYYRNYFTITLSYTYIKYLRQKWARVEIIITNRNLKPSP